MREWVKMMIKKIWVKNKKIVAIEPRDDFKVLLSVHRKVIAQAYLVAQEDIIVMNKREKIVL